MYGLRLFIVVLQDYHIVYIFVWLELYVSITSPNFVALSLPISEIVKCIAWGCLLLLYKNYIVYSLLFYGLFIEKYVYTKFRLDWLLWE